jgi:hypothetical protein
VGEGLVDADAMPEPYLGSLIEGQSRAAFLALNPGRVHPGFQSRSGVFAGEIEELGGSYTRWAATWPYLRDPWLAENGSNRHHTTRLAFLRTWADQADLPASAMVSFELFPWHSARVTASMSPDPALIGRFIWEPIADLKIPLVFAFGAPWFALLRSLDVEVVEILGAQGRPYGSRVESRSVLVGRTSAGTVVVAERHSGSAGPPAKDEAVLLRHEVERILDG